MTLGAPRPVSCGGDYATPLSLAASQGLRWRCDRQAQTAPRPAGRPAHGVTCTHRPPHHPPSVPDGPVLMDSRDCWLTFVHQDRASNRNNPYAATVGVLHDVSRGIKPLSSRSGTCQCCISPLVELAARKPSRQPGRREDLDWRTVSVVQGPQMRILGLQVSLLRSSAAAGSSRRSGPSRSRRLMPPRPYSTAPETITAAPGRDLLQLVSLRQRSCVVHSPPAPTATTTGRSRSGRRRPPGGRPRGRARQCHREPGRSSAQWSRRRAPATTAFTQSAFLLRHD